MQVWTPAPCRCGAGKATGSRSSSLRAFLDIRVVEQRGFSLFEVTHQLRNGRPCEEIHDGEGSVCLRVDSGEKADHEHRVRRRARRSCRVRDALHVQHLRPDSCASVSPLAAVPRGHVALLRRLRLLHLRQPRAGPLSRSPSRQCSSCRRSAQAPCTPRISSVDAHARAHFIRYLLH